MRVLIDTHILLWSLAQPRRIPAPYRRLLESGDNEVLFSAASIWELSIKLQVGRLNLPLPLEEIVSSAEGMGFLELPVTSAHAATVRGLPVLHRDPFDRLLVAQAIHEPARFLTADRMLKKYSALVDIVE